MEKLVKGKIQQFDYRRDFVSFLQIEINRFISPMNGMLTRFLIGKYGTKFWNVVDISGNQEIDAYLLGKKEEDNLHIISFAVRKEYESRGWGRKLLDYTINLARDSGISNITLEVREDNDRAQQLYVKSEFKEINKKINYYEDGADAIVMELKIK